MSRVPRLGSLHATEKVGRTMIDYIYNASFVEYWKVLSINHHSYLENHKFGGKYTFKHPSTPHLSTTTRKIYYDDP
jgi:hypothetical protein